MMILLAVAAISIFGLLVGPFFLFFAVQLIGADSFPDADVLHQMLVVTFLIAPAAAAYLSGCLVEKLSAWTLRARVWYPVAFVSGFAFALSPTGALGALEGALTAQPASIADAFPLLLSIMSSVFYCVALIGILLFGTALLCEIPFLWLSQQARLKFAGFARGMRPLIVVLLAAATFNLLADYITHQLSPSRIQTHGDRTQEVACG
jgi:hypothetical protein